ncbi:MAG: 5-deoxy-glucuronate isomerase [Myxococcales bacterium]|nr:5-deoxy-glucuronate isomerase [Myxococcales bacterium]
MEAACKGGALRGDIDRVRASPRLRAPSPWSADQTLVDATTSGLRLELRSRTIDAGGTIDIVIDAETAWLVVRGAGELELGGRALAFARRSPFDELGVAAIASATTPFYLRARETTELLVARAHGATREHEPLIIGPSDVRVDPRGRGLLADASYRHVRTYIDPENAPLASLVVGEVINPPGRWSSYPPHHHPQPEVYHYRFEPSSVTATPSTGKTSSKSGTAIR